MERALDTLKPHIPLDARHRVAQWRVEARRPVARWRRLPDLLVIGAQRSGTSTLYRQLGRHPDVTPSVRKEVEYFSRRYGRGERWYRAHFPMDVGRRRLAFEATPDYLFHSLAAARAADLLPDARLVALLRDPVDRAWSHHHHMVALGHEPLDPAAAFAAEEERCAGDRARLAADPLHDPVALLRYSYVARGHYAEQLRRWLDHFPPERLLVLRSEDLFDDPEGSFRRVTDFAGLAPWRPPSFGNVTRPRGDGPGRPPTEVRALLAPAFSTVGDDLAALLGPGAPRW